MKAFENAWIYVEGQGLQRTSVCFDTHIRAIGGCTQQAQILPLPETAKVLPGFIDGHIHGAGGSDALDGKQAISDIAHYVVKEGTTSFLATTCTESEERTLSAMTAVKEYRAENAATGARVLGAHLEGPFLCPKYKGAQNPDYLIAPNKEWTQKMIDASGNAVRQVTVAPEREGSLDLISFLVSKKIVASIGHTAATYAQICDAIDAGASNVTHTYNAQSSLHHRDVGTVGAALLHDCLQTELIADTIHVSVPAMQLLFRCKPCDKVTLITDGVRAKGCPDGPMELGGIQAEVKNGEARLPDGTLAGSTLHMNVALKNVVEKVGVPFLQAVDCATIHPARQLGFADEIGSIAVGKRADFAVLDEDFSVLMTIRDGEIVYKKQ